MSFVPDLADSLSTRGVEVTTADRGVQTGGIDSLDSCGIDLAPTVEALQRKIAALQEENDRSEREFKERLRGVYEENVRLKRLVEHLEKQLPDRAPVHDDEPKRCKVCEKRRKKPCVTVPFHGKLSSLHSLSSPTNSLLPTASLPTQPTTSPTTTPTPTLAPNNGPTKPKPDPTQKPTIPTTTPTVTTVTIGSTTAIPADTTVTPTQHGPPSVKTVLKVPKSFPPTFQPTRVTKPCKIDGSYRKPPLKPPSPKSFKDEFPPKATHLPSKKSKKHKKQKSSQISRNSSKNASKSSKIFSKLSKTTSKRGHKPSKGKSNSKSKCKSHNNSPHSKKSFSKSTKLKKCSKCHRKGRNFKKFCSKCKKSSKISQNLSKPKNSSTKSSDSNK